MSLKTSFHTLSDWLASPGLVARLFPRGASPSFAWVDARSIFVIKLDEIGDFVLATSFLRELRRAAPNSHITLIVKPAVLNLAETCPHVNRVLTYDGQSKGLRAWQLRRQWRAWRLACRELRARRFDAAIIPRWGEDAYNATHLARYSGANVIIAYTETATSSKQTMNRGFDRLATHVVPAANNGHEVEHNLRLIEHFGGHIEDDSLEIWLSDSDRDFAGDALTTEKKFVALAPGALDPARRWPAERFAMLTQWLKEKHELESVVLGSADDPAILGALDLRGCTTLRQAAAVLARCRLFVGNDTGLKHLGAAVGIPVVEISAFPAGADPNHSNSPARFHAWGVAHRVVQPAAAAEGAPALAIEKNSLAAVQAACVELLNQS